MSEISKTRVQYSVGGCWSDLFPLDGESVRFGVLLLFFFKFLTDYFQLFNSFRCLNSALNNLRKIYLVVTWKLQKTFPFFFCHLTFDVFEFLFTTKFYI